MTRLKVASMGLAFLTLTQCAAQVDTKPTSPARPASGRLPPPVIQAVIRTHYPSIRTCYEAGLGRNPQLKGRVLVRFVIAEDGSVRRAWDFHSTLPDSDVLRCIVQEFSKLQFPKPNGGIVTVVYPIMLAPG